MLFCSISGLPCRFPMVCTVCGAIYEESMARKRITDGSGCISGHELLSETCIPVKNGPVHTEESLEQVRISALSGVLDYFGSLVSSLASDNYGLRRQLAEKCSSSNSDPVVTRQMTLSHPHTSTFIDSTQTGVLELIQRHTPQLVAIRTSIPLLPAVQASPDSLLELKNMLNKHLTLSASPIFKFLSGEQKPSVTIEPDHVWPIYRAPHANSDRISVIFIAVSSKFYLEMSGSRLPIDGTAMLFVQSSYIHSAQDLSLTLQDILPLLNLSSPPKMLVTSYEVSHIHPYGSCIYARYQTMLMLIPIAFDHLDSLIDASISISVSTTYLSQTQLDAPVLSLTYEGDFLGVHPDGRLLLTYLPDQSVLLLSDICQLSYKFGPLLRYRLENLHPITAAWDGTGKQFTLLGRDGNSIHLRLEKGTFHGANEIK